MPTDTTSFQAAIISCLDFCEYFLIDFSSFTFLSTIHFFLEKNDIFNEQISSFFSHTLSLQWFLPIPAQLLLTPVSLLAFYSPAILDFLHIIFLESGPSHAWCILSNVLLPLPTSSTHMRGTNVVRDSPKECDRQKFSISIPTSSQASNSSNCSRPVLGWGERRGKDGWTCRIIYFLLTSF